LTNRSFNNIYSRQKSTFAIILDALFTTIIVFLAFVLFVVLAYEPIAVDGQSMLPTIQDRDKVAVSRMDKSYEKGDIVVAEKGNYFVIKRVIATSNDKIAFAYDQSGVIRLFINDFTTPVSEEYIKEPMTDSGKFKAVGIAPDFDLVSLEAVSITLGEGELLLLGDNRNNSTDSRVDGVYKTEQIKGKMSFNITENGLINSIFDVIYKIKYGENAAN